MVKLCLIAALAFICLVPEPSSSKILSFPLSYNAPAANLTSTFNINPPYQEPVTVKVYVDSKLMYTYDVMYNSPGAYLFPVNSTGKNYRIEATTAGGQTQSESGVIG